MQPRFYVPKVSERPLRQTGKVGAYRFEVGTSDQQDAVASLFRGHAQASWELYEYLLGMGVAKEASREYLPLATMTSFWATANPRNLMHFLALRTEQTALYEIRDVANQMEAIFAERMPLTHAAWKRHKWN